MTDTNGAGWKEARFAQSVPIAANTTYTVSYYTPNGYYAYDANYFTGNQGVSNFPLYAIANAS